MCFQLARPPVRSLSVGFEGLTAVYGIVRCRVRTEQNIAPISSTAAAVTIQTLVVVGLQARSDKGWLVNVSPLGGAPCGPTMFPLLPVALLAQASLDGYLGENALRSANINVHLGKSV